MFRRALLAGLISVSLSCASSGSTTDGETGPPVETVEHTVTYAIGCSGTCRTTTATGTVQGSRHYTSTCTHGQELRVSVTPGGSGGRVSVRIFVDGAEVGSARRSTQIGDTSRITVRATCE